MAVNEHGKAVGKGIRDEVRVMSQQLNLACQWGLQEEIEVGSGVEGLVEGGQGEGDWEAASR